MKKLITLSLLFSAFNISYSQDTEEEFSLTTEQINEIMVYQKFSDSVDSTFVYQTGKVNLGNGVAYIDVPEGFKFLDAKQSEYVLTTLWGNPPQETMGMLFPKDESPMASNSTYAVEISYSEEGYVSDEDAAEIDYDELLEDMQSDEAEINKQRKEAGYETIHMVGWASSPYYDHDTKKLHWAKELKFESYDVNTLNYNIRILGRNGYLNLNAIGDITVLDKFNEGRDVILNSVHFDEGYTYAEFDPSIDKVAAYGIGGLIAGKVLAKAGFFAILLKFGKFIVIGIIGLFAAFKNKIFGGGNKKDNYPTERED